MGPHSKDLYYGLKSQGTWVPRKLDGKPVATTIRIPITFKIEDYDAEELQKLKSLQDSPSHPYDVLFEEIVVVGHGNPARVSNETQGDDKVYKVVQEMPRFPGCESINGNKNAKSKCANEKLIEYVYKKLNYPVKAREDKIEGRVYVQFIVEKDGTLSNAKIVRDIGAGCGLEALRVMENMNTLSDRWTPGKHYGKIVRVLYTVPVTFKL